MSHKHKLAQLFQSFFEYNEKVIIGNEDYLKDFSYKLEQQGKTQEEILKILQTLSQTTENISLGQRILEMQI